MILRKKFQQGGQMEDQEAMQQETAPIAGGAQDPMQTIVELFVNGLQNQDCNALAEGAQMFLQLVQEARGGAEAAPAGQPVFAKGGKLVSRKQNSIKLVCE